MATKVGPLCAPGSKYNMNTFMCFIFGLFYHFVLSRAYSNLPDEGLYHIPSGGPDFDAEQGSLLAPLLIPRVPGTPGSAKAQAHFVDFFARQLPLWTLEWHNHSSTTPATGETEVPFANLILRRDPPWASAGDVSRLTLVAHYDSLYRPDGFIGATDSAVPCAILMHVARSVDQALTRKWDAMVRDGEMGDGLEEEKGVQILFLDGEEAWVSWTDEDSLYGARSLAETWESTTNEPLSTYATPLQSISLFVLLDLLGAPKPRVPSYFRSTHWAYQSLAAVETRMRKLGLLETEPDPTSFLPETGKHQFSRGYVADDHIPFMKRGVEILHVIPTPFPPVWHTMDDDGAHLDLPTIRDWAKIMTAFVVEWMELGELLSAEPSQDEKLDQSRPEKEL